MMLRRCAALLALALLSACAANGARDALPPAQQAGQRPPVTILVSIDGFSPDYLRKGRTPRLDALAASGVQARMRPSFPSKTFPNHYTMVTGLVPDRNGIVANKMEDPRRPGETFTMASDDPFWWNEAVPIWVDAEQAGVRTATMFWPGSNVAIGGRFTGEWPVAVEGGTRPSDWQQYNQEIAEAQRVASIVDWMRRPASTRPRFAALYFDTVDTAGHAYGPAAAKTMDAVAEVDALIGTLIDELGALGQPANLLIVADHGMAATSSARTIALDSLLDAGDYRLVEHGTYASLHALPGRTEALEAKLLRPHEHMQCWRKAEIPAHLSYGRNPRVPPYLCLAEVGWQIAPSMPAEPDEGGEHGYDPYAPEMAALFIADGPDVRDAVTLPPFDNVDVHPLLARLLGIAARPGDGDPATADAVLER